jgi:hypothetical protein
VDRCVKIRSDGTSYRVSVEFDDAIPLGLHVHHGERDAAVRMLMVRSIGTVIRPDFACVFDGYSKRAAEVLADAIRDRLRKVARKPLSQRKVEDILQITSRERIRWGKDGRLARSGTASIRRGATLITLWTYPCDTIEQLARSPDTIRAWRAADQTRSSIGIVDVFV